uniref:Microtubule-actin cross-linking factor 1 n=2 Tax=Aceria tosichella TaxID=561515 RepID=A0A6G1SE26_9ACAR
MARSTAGSPGGHWHSRVARDANRARDNRGNINRAPPPSHHGSELSFGSQDGAGGETLARGPISMPGSPRSSSSSSSSRRRRQQSNSPRMNQSPVPFHSPPTESTKIEDGLKVCSIEHFEKHIGNIKDDQIEAQKRLFTVWINHFAPNLIRHDLFEELRDGTKIIGLLAALTRDRDLIAKYERLMKDRQTYVNRLVLSPGGQMRNLSNVQFAIDYLRTKLNMRLVSLHPMDIVGSKANVILGLCWSIILHFQLDRDLFKDSETSSQLSDSLCTTSPLSSGSTRDDDQRTAPQSTRITHNRQNLNLTQPPRHKSSTGGGEFTQKELAHAREKLLEHINKRFNLKLTNLTSSLVDGDVLLAIIKQLLWPAQEHFNKNNPKLSNWRTMSDDEKLDCCFELANEYLNVPKLISASDLRRQTISENNTKPLLVYLSMLLKSNPRNCSTDQMLELRQLDESLEGSNQQAAVAVTKSFPNIVLAGQQQEPNVANADDSSFEHNLATKEEILAAIDELDTDDERFHIHKLQTSIARINQIERSLKDHGLRSNDDDATTTTLKRFTNLKQQADQIEFLISWINKADKLFERKQKSSSDLAKTIEEYQSFFAPSNLPQVNTALCPTLERQYRECLATAKQRVLSMEQTMKNWISYEQARQDLRNWLKTAEMKLTDSLRPDSSTNTTSPTAQPFKQDGSSVDYVGHYSSRLDDLIEYFELEPVDIDDLERAQNCSFLSSSLQDELSTSSLNNSLSGSLLSLGSNTSRLSALTSSKKATYGRLFDNFELKCRLLATMLDSDQRDSLLLGVRELKSRLKYIIDCKVPQVINEIRLSIDRCEMSIKEQDEICSDLEQEAVESLDRVLASHDNDEEDDGDDDDDEVSSPSEQQNMDDLKRDNNSSTTNTTSPECTSDVAAASVVYDDGANDLIMTKSKEKKRNRNNKANNNKSKTKSSQHHNQKSGSKKSNSSSTPTKTLVKVTSKVSACVGDNDDECIPYYRMLWNKICRASKMSLSFNIVLLVCLAGICIIPLIQRDACCELSQAPVPSDRFTINQRPT